MTIGENLMHSVDPDCALIDATSVQRTIQVPCNPDSHDALRADTIWVQPETILAEDMKGIGYNYRTYHIHEPYTLRAQFAEALQISQHHEGAAGAGEEVGEAQQFVRDMHSLRTRFQDI